MGDRNRQKGGGVSSVSAPMRRGKNLVTPVPQTIGTIKYLWRKCQPIISCVAQVANKGACAPPPLLSGPGGGAHHQASASSASTQNDPGLRKGGAGGSPGSHCQEWARYRDMGERGRGGKEEGREGGRGFLSRLFSSLFNG